MMLKQLGFTLLEVLVVLVVIAILYSVSVPSLETLQQKFYVKQELAHMQLLLASSRQHAIMHKKRVRACPLNNSQSCSNDWNQEITLFEDLNNNNKLDPSENIIHQFNKVSSNKGLRAFSNTGYISFNAQGFSGYAVGSFSYCHKGKQNQGGVFVISRTGRARFIVSQQGNFPKLANGNPIPCL